MRRNCRGRGWGKRPYPKDKNSIKYSTQDNRSINSRNSTTTSYAPINVKPVNINLNVNCRPYKSWKLYFPLHDYKSESDVDKKIKATENYIENNRSTFDIEKIESSQSVALDLQHLLNDDLFKKAWPTCDKELSEKPDSALACISLAFHEFFNLDAKIQVRLLNHQPIVSISNLKINYFGKLVTIKGTVIRVGSVGLICTSMTFECLSCHGVQAVVQPQGVFTAPTCCIQCNKQAKFQCLQTSPYTITSDWQTARVQEIQSQGVSGSIPKSVEIELQGNLVGTACPGDVLSVTGIVQVRGETKGGEDGRKAARLLQLYIEAVSVHSQRNFSHPSLAFTVKDYYAIQEIHGSPDVFRLLVHSLCPPIFGHELVKAGLILGLLGGTDKEDGPRANPHILVVGDPGLGKSQLLQAAAHAAPRGVYVCGASASAGGLTVALGREAGGDFALEAGALVLADKGVCCVDELDKMTAHHGSLLETMEQQTVSVAKGGVVCCLAARATVLAAANPVGGHYNKAKTVAENLRLNSALLSRFDLVFILMDKPNERIDALLSEHVLALHSGSKGVNNACKSGKSTTSFKLNQGDFNSLDAQLRLKPGEVIDSLPLVLLRKYIAYGRRYVHPKLTAEAAQALQEFYLQLRKTHQASENANSPITTRQLEACIRLTQARARVDLREEATEQDAQDVISLVKHSLIDTFSDEFGNIQLSRSINGSGVSSRSVVKRFLDIILRRASQVGKDVFTRQELVSLHKAANLKGNAYDLIEAMHVHSYLLLKGPNLYRVVSL